MTVIKDKPWPPEQEEINRVIEDYRKIHATFKAAFESLIPVFRAVIRGLNDFEVNNRDTLAKLKAYNESTYEHPLDEEE